MSNETTRTKEYNLKSRTLEFAKKVLYSAKKIERNVVTLPLISQYIRAGTSIGANYSEADNAETRKDFVHKIGICKKEAEETCYWLELLIDLFPDLVELQNLKIESKELHLIFVAIIRKTKI